MYVRSAEANDLRIINDLEKDSFDEPYPQFLIERLLIENPSTFLVATSDSEEVIGYCVASANEELAHLISMAVRREYRRKGIGTMLLSTLSERLKSDGVVKVYLEVNAHNKAAIALYSSFGFVTDGTMEKYYADGSPALKMHLDMSAGHESQA